MIIPVERTTPHSPAKSAAEVFPDAAHRPSSRDLPSLDGLRAVSIAFVLVGHWSQGHAIPDLRLVHLADLGVLVFFVISGYLITTLLCREAQKRRDVSLRRFYLRRTLRIFPPYYSYLAVIALASVGGVLVIPSETRWWSALSYVTNFVGTNNPLMRHTWSLSLEEQFYITWPGILAFWIRRSATANVASSAILRFIVALITFPIILRVVVFALTRDGGLTGQFILDYFAAGSALAVLESVKGERSSAAALDFLMHRRWMPMAGLAVLALHFGFTGNLRWDFAVNMLILTPAKATLLACFVVWTVRNPRHTIGRFLNWRLMRVVGVGSYSLYLWQQMFFAPGASFTTHWSAPLRLAAALTCAAISYFVIERPSLRLRARVERKFFPLPA